MKRDVLEKAERSLWALSNSINENNPMAGFILAHIDKIKTGLFTYKKLWKDFLEASNLPQGKPPWFPVPNCYDDSWVDECAAKSRQAKLLNKIKEMINECPKD